MIPRVLFSWKETLMNAPVVFRGELGRFVKELEKAELRNSQISHNVPIIEEEKETS